MAAYDRLSDTALVMAGLPHKVARRALVSEVEDSMRKQEAGGSDFFSGDWPATRKACLDMAAWLLLVVETGDRSAASEEEGAQD